MNTPLLNNQPAEDNYQPLASRMRPTSLNDFIGQSHLMAPGKALHQAIVNNSHEPLKQSRFYYPVQSGLEIRIKEKMDYFRKLDTDSNNQRYQNSKKV